MTLRNAIGIVCAFIFAQGPLTLPLCAAQNIKSVNGVTLATLKSANGVAKANVKSIGGVDNTSGGGGGITYLTSVAQGSTNGLGFTTASINTTGASLIVAVICDYVAETATVLTDSQSQTWTILTTSTGVVTRCRIAYTIPSSTSAMHTFTLTQAGSYPSICVACFSGTHATTPFDVQNGATGSGTSIQTGSVTPTTDGQLLIAGITGSIAGAVAINSSFVDLLEVTNSGGAHLSCSLAYYIQPTAAAINPTWSWSGSDQVATRIASFKTP